jgi:hypothetical protein
MNKKKYQISDQQGCPVEGLIVETGKERELIQTMLEEDKCFPGWSFEEIEEENKPPVIISFEDHTQYQKTLSQLIEQVSAISDEIYDNLFALACQGKWKEWDNSQPIGTELHVDEEMLRNTGDKNIDLFWEILDKIEEVKKKIQK